MDRRKFLALLSSAMALTAVGCRRPEQKIVSQPYAVEYIKQGQANFYSSVYQQKNSAYGIVIKTREGRPIKIDGNDIYPVNRTSSNAKMQAELYALYDPKRFRKPKINFNSANLDEAIEASISAIKEAIGNGLNIVFFYEKHCSPTFKILIDYVSLHISNFKFICLSTFGQLSKKAYCNRFLLDWDACFVPQISKANFILSIADDFLVSDSFSLFYANEFSKLRDFSSGKIAKLVTVESSLSLTGANSDKRIVMNPWQYESFVARILYNILATLESYTELNCILPLLQQYTSVDEILEKKIAEGLVTNGDRACVIVDENLSLKIQLYATLINYICGNIGEGKIFDPRYAEPFNNSENTIDLLNILDGSKTGYIILADCCPLDSAIVEIREFYKKFDRGKTISLSYYDTDFNKSSGIQIPTTHFLECWGDAISFNECYSIQQPVISPLNPDSISTYDFLFRISKRIKGNDFSQFNSYYDFLKNNWEKKIGQDKWEDLLKTGIFTNMQGSTTQINLNLQNLFEILRKDEIRSEQNKYILHIRPSYKIMNHKDAHNPFLQELPHTLTTHSWDNVFLISPLTAEKLNVIDNDIIRITNNNISFEAPILIQEGICDDLISFEYTFSNERIFDLLSFNADNNLYKNNFFAEVEVSRTGDKTNIAKRLNSNKNKSRLNLSKVILASKLFDQVQNLERQKNSESQEGEKKVNNYEYYGYYWGMAIDTSKCIGCGACIVACQIENNIPIVGKEEAIRHRLMHWIRIERYASTSEQNSVFVPIMCQHCEQAPCEPVCPVNATTHSPEGINEMTYNRCIGSRFCMVNCPYQVRSFNYKDYHSNEKEPLECLHNPDVTIRMRGIAEKCTLCIQRIIQGKYKARDEGKLSLVDGEIKTACQVVCPTGAIVFGDLNNPISRVKKMKQLQNSYTLLEELNTKPSVFYLSKIMNEF